MFQGERIAIFGVPDCGKVCSEKHVPGFVAEADTLRHFGITKILCVVVGDASEAQQWAEKLNLDHNKVKRSSWPFCCQSKCGTLVWCAGWRFREQVLNPEYKQEINSAHLILTIAKSMFW